METSLRLKRLEKKAEILLIHNDDCFTFVPGLYETAAGEQDESNVCILASQLLHQKDILHYRDTVLSIDPKKKRVHTKNIKTIHYDVLIIAIGAQTNYYAVPGAQQYLLDLKTRGDAQQIYEYVSWAISSKKKHQFSICGAGLTGVEFASSLQEHIFSECRQRKKNPKNFSVSLIDAAPSILASLPDKAIKAATAYLKKQGISLLTDKKIRRVTQSRIFCSKESLAYDLGVWCGGLRTHPLIIESSLEYSEKAGERGLPGGGMMVNEFLQSTTHPSIFGAGDCICPKNPALPYVKTAQNAIDQARYIAYNVHALLNGRKLKPYRQMKNKFYCSLGKEMGVFVSGKTVLSGKHIKKKKDKLESTYVDTIKAGKVTSDLYG